MSQRTIPQMFETSVQKFGSSIMMWEKKQDSYKSTTYREIHGSVHRCAAGLLSIGIKKGDRIALIAEGRNDWVIAELGIVYIGAINVPISVKIEELSELKFRLLHAGCKAVIVSATQISKILQIERDLPDLEKIILFDTDDARDEDVVLFSDLLVKGKEYLVSHQKEFENVWQSIQENDPANICYTSGTTADPKGIVLTHRNYTANVE
ncbi:MAG: acyl--CoA ligase, partial [Ignavibacteriales bacterium]|nr:acyl--CoA ligase [Ignavibacteriales bacterium]